MPEPLSPLNWDLDSWRLWLAQFAALLQAPADAAAPPAAPPGSGAHCMVFAPHPDDECITGALPLRLRQEAGWRVSAVAVTLGSLVERRPARRLEMQLACSRLGFELRELAPTGLESLKPDAPHSQPAAWRAQIEQVAGLLRSERPELVLMPHALDGNATHQGVHRLVSEAIAQAGLSCRVALSEYWAPQVRPNLMVQTSVADTARLIHALAAHAGELTRNPYHLRLPAWMADNVRRGAELIGGAGSAAPQFAFATLYQLSQWVDGAWQQDLTPMICTSATALTLRA